MFALKNISKFLVLLLLVLSSNLKSQTLLDTINKQLNSDISIEDKLNVIKKYSNPLLFSYPDTLAYYCNYALKMCKVSDNKIDEAIFLGMLGEAHFRMSNYSDALSNSFAACKLFEEQKDSLELAGIYNSIGSIYRVSNKLEDAKEYFTKSIEMSETIRDSAGLASSYNNIGIIYMMTSSYDTGMTYWGNALDIKLAIGDSFGAATTMNNIAMYYRDIGETDKALDFFHKALGIKKRYKDYTSISMAYLNLGELYLKLNNYEKGENYYRMALEEAKLSKSKQLISWVYMKLAETYYDKGKYKIAYDNFIMHSNLEDTIFSEENMKNLNEIEEKYQNEKKALLIENLEKEQEAQKDKEQLIVISSGVGFGAMLIIIIIILRGYRQKKRDNTIISNQKNILFDKNREITDSITYAKRLQEAILPPTELIKKQLPNSFIVFQPKDVVSGDFYWLEPVQDKVIFAVADCTGHGVPGAMVSVVCSNALNRAVKEFKLTNPAKILDKVRELVVETFRSGNESKNISLQEIKDGMDISLCTLNTKTNELEYAGANNPLWILRKNLSEIEEIKADKQPIGVYHDTNKSFSNHKVNLNEGDTIFLFSDGYADQFGGEKGKKLKYKPFKELLISMRSKSMLEQKILLAEAFNTWKGSMEQIDDVCVMGIII